MQIYPSDGCNDLGNVFPDPTFDFPDLGLFRGESNGFHEANLAEGLIVDILPSADPTNSDIWNMLLASVPEMTPGAADYAPSDLRGLPVGPPVSPEQSRQQTRSIFGLGTAGHEQAQVNLASYDPDQKFLTFRFPSKYACIRYVKAYFEYMDPQLPIIHGPTFDASTVPCTYTQKCSQVVANNPRELQHLYYWK